MVMIYFDLDNYLEGQEIKSKYQNRMILIIIGIANIANI